MSAVDPDMYHIASKATRNMNKSLKKKKMIGPLLQILLLLDTVARIIDVEDKRLFFFMAPTVLGKKKKC